jgi:NADH-quinone oxidoreductase subunit M
MSESMLLLLLPLASMLIVSIYNGDKGLLSKGAVAVSLISFLASVYVMLTFNPTAGYQSVVSYNWIPSLGINLMLGLDGLSLLLVMLTNFLIPVIILSTVNREIKHQRAFYALIFLMQFALIGVFMTLDAFVFYVFWELALIPIYFICLIWGGKDSGRITLKFFLYTLAGSLFMLVGIIYLYLLTPGNHSFSIQSFYALTLTPTEQSYLFWAFFLAFAIKIPIWPLHTWQPDTYTNAPTAGTMLLSGIMLKMGIYGLMRWMLPVLPSGVLQWQNLVMILCVVSVVYASFMALIQQDFKRMVAYASMAHVGLIAAGVFANNIYGFQGATMQMLAHGINAVGLFYIVDIIYTKTGTSQINQLGGIAQNNRLFTILFMIIMLGTIALPLTNGFVGEFLLLNGIFNYSIWFAAFAGLTIILGAVYMLRSYKSIMLGNVTNTSGKFESLQYNEKLVLILIAFIIIVMGICPNYFIKIAQPTLENIFQLSHK